jgi:rhodanese-related sulfurtransferase
MKLLATILMSAIIFLSGCSAAEDNNEYRKNTPEEAKKMMDSSDVIILDVRTEQEFAEARIENAIVLPDYDIEKLAPEMLTNQEATILVYCRSGRRSEAAAKALIEMGNSNTYDFGGIIDWSYDTVSGD